MTKIIKLDLNMEKIGKLGIIPARYASTRFPGKPLAMIGNKAMVQRVYEQCLMSTLDAVLVATDDERIASVVRDFGGQVVITDPNLPSGTDRCRAALLQLDYSPDYVVNIQGDEPFIAPEQIDSVLSILTNMSAPIATLISPAMNAAEVENINRVKVVKDKNGKALYFSRKAIPYTKSGSLHQNHFIHLGIYGFKSEILLQLGKLKPSVLEISESLEQLRWLENGYEIYTRTTEIRADSVDTLQDLVDIEKKFFFDRPMG